VSVTLNSALAPIVPHLNSLLHDHAVVFHFFIYKLFTGPSCLYFKKSDVW